MIYFDNVTKVYPENKEASLLNVSFNIYRGEFVFLMGHSGAGKSTAIKLLLAEERPTHGEVTIDKFRISKLRPGDVPMLRRRLGVVFQDFRLLPNKTVYENVAFAMQIIGESKKKIRRRVPDVLTMVGLAHKAKSYPSHLSGGEQQRVSMARALANHPEVLIADEPTGNLDNDMALEIVSILDSINRRGTTIVMATHAEHIVNDMNKRVIMFDKGVVVKDKVRSVLTGGN